MASLVLALIFLPVVVWGLFFVGPRAAAAVGAARDAAAPPTAPPTAPAAAGPQAPGAPGP